MNQAEIAAWQARSGKRLNCGAGDYPLEYYINLDADSSKAADIHATVPPIPFGDAALEEIAAVHFLEHLSFGDANRFLAECFRCLEDGGQLAIVVPDIREVMKRYLAESSDCIEWPWRVWRPVADLDEVCHLFLYSDIQETPHLWSWDLRTLARAMKRAGFTDLKEIDRYRDRIISVGSWYQVGLRGTKPKET